METTVQRESALRPQAKRELYERNTQLVAEIEALPYERDSKFDLEFE